MQNTRQSWAEIKQQYDNHWVELVDYDWPDEEPYPRAGVVRVCAKDRRQFDLLVAKDAPSHSAFIYVGQHRLSPDTYLSTFRVLAD